MRFVIIFCLLSNFSETLFSRLNDFFQIFLQIFYHLRDFVLRIPAGRVRKCHVLYFFLFIYEAEKSYVSRYFDVKILKIATSKL
jgi:hypothetical protein